MSNINEISKLSELLGESNRERLQSAITDALIGQFQDDLASYTEYMFNYEEIFREVEHEVRQVVKDKLLKIYLSQVEEKFDELFPQLSE